jgi:hypothetical protein
VRKRKSEKESIRASEKVRKRYIEKRESEKVRKGE